jgi:hypothetical protein
MAINRKQVKRLLDEHRFDDLFIDELGWQNPSYSSELKVTVDKTEYCCAPVAEIGGVVALRVTAKTGTLADAKERKAVHTQVSKSFLENLLIFTDAAKTQSVWYWVKRQGGKSAPRTHFYVKGQPGDLFLSKIASILFDFSDFDTDGRVNLMEALKRVKDALDVERVTKKFFTDFEAEHVAFTQLIQGIADEKDRRWYASVLLNRLMFIWFLQGKMFLDNGDTNYLPGKLTASCKQGKNRFYNGFLETLFFEGFARPEHSRSAEANALLGKIKYLNGGLFLEHRIEQQYPKISVPDSAFENLFALFKRYSWNLNDIPGGDDNEINPDVLGYIFEKYINQKEFGAYYTRPEITEYLCEQTINRLILDQINTPGIPGVVEKRDFKNVGDLLLHLDTKLCRRLLDDVLPSLKLLDPACGSGAFLVAAMRTLINIYSAVIGKIKFLTDPGLTKWLAKTEKEHPNINYFIKKSIITNNLFGVDIMEEAMEIAKLRLFLALVASAETVDQLEPLPNIDFNIMAGNSLIGLLQVDSGKFNKNVADGGTQALMKMKHQGGAGEFGFEFETATAASKKELAAAFVRERRNSKYEDILREKNRLIDLYRRQDNQSKEYLTKLRDDISAYNREAGETLNELLLSEFKDELGIQFEEAQWDIAKNKEAKPKKRKLRTADMEALTPFHWGYEFDRIIKERGGFDAIITNPPWEIFKPNGKEFFLRYSDLITRKKMRVEDFKDHQQELLKDPDVLAAWQEYLGSFTHVSAYYRAANCFQHQIGEVNGKKTGSDINLYKLFTERCHLLLRTDGQCGIVIPSGIYTDLGAKALREMLFGKTRITGLFCFENRKEIFEGVHRSFKFVSLTFSKGGKTEHFPAAFMRHEVQELDGFPETGAIDISVDLVRKLSPDSLSVMEFKTPLDVQIAEKMLRFPLLGEEIPDKWNVKFSAEFHMTNDSYLFKDKPGKGLLPLYEGKMIWQFQHGYTEPRYWVDEKAGRAALLGRDTDTKQKLDYQAYRLGFRDVTASTNERSLIASVVPANVFCGNTLPTLIHPKDGKSLLAITSVFDSFLADWLMRQKITNHCNFFYMEQIPVPRLTEGDSCFAEIVERAAKLICTAPEFDDLAKEVGIRSHKNGVTDPVKRQKLRAELDALIAHLYGLTETEFRHILTTFPLVDESVKTATLNEFLK